MTKITGKNVTDLFTASAIYGTLFIEMEHNYYWNETWTQEEERDVVKGLFESQVMKYRYNWDSPLIKRLLNGALVRELNKNFNSVLNNENKKKLYIYSTHDTEVAGLMSAFNIFNGMPPPFGAAILLELHQKKNSSGKSGEDFFVKVFYYNETVINSGFPHSVQWRDCQDLYDCPFNQYLDSTKHLLYEDYDKECNN